MSLVKLAASNEELGFTPGGIWAGRGIGAGAGGGLGYMAGKKVAPHLAEAIAQGLEQMGHNVDRAVQIPALKKAIPLGMLGVGALGGSLLGGRAAKVGQVYRHAKAVNRKHPIASTLLSRRDWEDTYANTKDGVALKTLAPLTALKKYVYKTVGEKN